MGKTIDRILNNIDLMQYMEQCGYHPTPIGSCYTLKEHDSVRIYPESNTYFHSSRTNKRLNVINFVEWYFNLSNQEAIKKLASELNDTSFRNNVQRNKPVIIKKQEVKKLVLPKKSQEQYKHVFAYLNKSRYIDRQIIQKLIDKNMLYEDMKHNATFTAYYPNSEPCFCYQRGTYDKADNPFKRVITGSDFSQGWYLDNKAKNLFITEAIIDNLSIMTILKMHGLNYMNYDYLATCGTSLKAVIHQVTQRPQIKTIYLAYDNDKAGHKYRSKARKELYSIGFQGKIIDKIPITKDFNQDLKTMLQAKTQPITNENLHTIGRK